MNVAIDINVDTSREELIDLLNWKVKRLQASLRATDSEMIRTVKAASSSPGSSPAQATEANQGKAD